jgi:hypothetical protein
MRWSSMADRLNVRHVAGLGREHARSVTTAKCLRTIPRSRSLSASPGVSSSGVSFLRNSLPAIPIILL